MCDLSIRICNKCKQSFPIEIFRQKRLKQCKYCINKARKVWYQKNRKKMIAITTAYKQKSSKYKEYFKQYRKTDAYKDSIKRAILKRKLLNKKIYKYNNKNYKYKKLTLEQKIKLNMYRKNRYKNDISFRLSTILRSRLNKALRLNLKVGSSIKDLGCSSTFLKTYLESLFQPGMTWENYGNRVGKWSVDHIIPLSKVDLTNREEFLKVCHYTNLQPMWHIDNSRKHNKILV